MKRMTQLFLIMILGVASSAHAGTKEELIRLQADVLALKNQISLLEKTFTERNEAIRSLVVQLSDSVGKSSLALARISTALDSQATGSTSNQDTLLNEVKSLSSKMDDVNTRISALAQQIVDLKVQSKPITPRIFQTAAGANPEDLALSADQIYNEAFNDLVQGNFDLAIQGFTAFLTNFPDHERADDAQYNIGEAYYNQRKYPEAIDAFSRVVANYATGDKVASALFKRGKARLALQLDSDAAGDFKTVLTKYPSAPEASLARAELEKLGINPAKIGKTPTKKKSS